MFQAQSTQLTADVQEKNDVGPRFLDTEMLGWELAETTIVADDSVTVEEYSDFDPATELVFRERRTARSRIERLTELLETGVDAFTLEKLARIEYDRYWDTAGRLRGLWRHAEGTYGDGDTPINIRYWTIPQELLEDCEQAGYSRSKVAECYAQMVAQSAPGGRYASEYTAPAGRHAKNLLKWLQYLSPDHDSGWTVPWSDVLGDKRWSLRAGPANNARFWPDVVRLFSEGFPNRYGRVHGGITCRLRNMLSQYTRLLASRPERQDIWFGPKADDFYYFRSIPRTGMFIDVKQYRPSPELFQRAVENGMTPAMIRTALDEYRERAIRKTDDIALHEWRMQRFLFHRAICEGLAVDQTFGRGSRANEVARPHACVSEGVFLGLLDIGGRAESAKPVLDVWGLFDGIYPPVQASEQHDNGSTHEPEKKPKREFDPNNLNLPPDVLAILDREQALLDAIPKVGGAEIRRRARNLWRG